MEGIRVVDRSQAERVDRNERKQRRKEKKKERHGKKVSLRSGVACEQTRAGWCRAWWEA